MRRSSRMSCEVVERERLKFIARTGQHSIDSGRNQVWAVESGLLFLEEESVDCWAVRHPCNVCANAGTTALQHLLLQRRSAGLGIHECDITNVHENGTRGPGRVRLSARAHVASNLSQKKKRIEVHACAFCTEARNGGSESLAEVHN